MRGALDRAVWVYGWDDSVPAEVDEDKISARPLALYLAGAGEASVQRSSGLDRRAD